MKHKEPQPPVSVRTSFPIPVHGFDVWPDLTAMRPMSDDEWDRLIAVLLTMKPFWVKA